MGGGETDGGIIGGQMGKRLQEKGRAAWPHREVKPCVIARAIIPYQESMFCASYMTVG